jgi:hypothetical protein
MGCRLQVNLKFATDGIVKPIASSFSHFDSCQLSCNRTTAETSNFAKQSTSSDIVINHKQELHWNPTVAISNSRYINSNIRTFVEFNIEDRNDLPIQYSVLYKLPFCLSISVKKIMLLDYLHRHTLMKRLTLQD